MFAYAHNSVAFIDKIMGHVIFTKSYLGHTHKNVGELWSTSKILRNFTHYVTTATFFVISKVYF